MQMIIQDRPLYLSTFQGAVRTLNRDGPWGTLIFSYIRRLGPFFGGSKFWISIFLGISEKKIGVLRVCWHFFGHNKIGLVLGVIFMHFRVLKVQNGDIFWGCCENFKYYFGVFDTPDIFLNSRWWAQAYVWRKNESTPLWEGWLNDPL